MSAPTIYVVVEVTYDYYRFQENLGAFISLEAAREFIATGDNCYKDTIIEDVDRSRACDNPETPHIWIEKFNP